MANHQLPKNPHVRPRGTDLPDSEEPSMLGVALLYFHEQFAELCIQEPLVHSGDPEAVHDMRTATRRLRSVLEIYGNLFATDPCQSLKRELKWLSGVLGRTRDAEVILDRLRTRINELPAEWQTAKITGALEHGLHAPGTTGHKRTRKKLSSKRCRRLLKNLEHFRDHPPAAGPVVRPTRVEVATLVNHQARLADRSFRAALRSEPGRERDEALHRLRKDTKRLLHAAEAAAAPHPKHSVALGRRVRKLQRILGNYQDSVMTREYLETFIVDPDLPAETRQAYQRIIAVERLIAEAAERQYLQVRRKSPALRLRH
ncbi:CHAD domain-containing protein [Glutamicibacter arilaitensis]|uniref:CHAD domain-containing protein n=1 Tax=Glutamicibacter arilaitensis TaxID=256701 RepID=UPI00385044BA